MTFQTTKSSITSFFTLGLVSWAIFAATTVFASGFQITTGDMSSSDCSVRLRGSVSVSGSTKVLHWFEYWKAGDANPMRAGWSVVFVGSEDFSATIEAKEPYLKPNTTYYYHASATSGETNDVVSGYDRTFTTKSFGTGACGVVAYSTSSNPGTTPSNPVVTPSPYKQISTTQTPSKITDTSARLNSTVAPLAGDVNYGWYEWGSTPDLGNSTQKTPLNSGISVPFSQDINGLTPGTTYFYRPVISNSSGTYRGQMLSFRTTGVAPYTAPVIDTAHPTNTSSLSRVGTRKVTVSVQKDQTNETIVKLTPSKEGSLAAAALLSQMSSGNNTSNSSGFGTSSAWILFLSHILTGVLAAIVAVFAYKKVNENTVEDNEPFVSVPVPAPIIPITAPVFAEVTVPKKPSIDADLPEWAKPGQDTSFNAPASRKAEPPENLPF